MNLNYLYIEICILYVLLKVNCERIISWKRVLEGKGAFKTSEREKKRIQSDSFRTERKGKNVTFFAGSNLACVVTNSRLHARHCWDYVERVMQSFQRYQEMLLVYSFIYIKKDERIFHNTPYIYYNVTSSSSSSSRINNQYYLLAACHQLEKKLSRFLNLTFPLSQYFYFFVVNSLDSIENHSNFSREFFIFDIVNNFFI